MRGILRGRLGFNGLTLSDCMVMDAIRKHYGTADGVVTALRAGVDIVFVSSDIDLQRESAAAVLAAAEQRKGKVCLYGRGTRAVRPPGGLRRGAGYFPPRHNRARRRCQPRG